MGKTIKILLCFRFVIRRRKETKIGDNIFFFKVAKPIECSVKGRNFSV